MNSMLLRLCILLSTCTSLYIEAHEVRPALFNLTEIEDGANSQASAVTFDVVWKQPISNGKRLRLDPLIPKDCSTTVSKRDEILPGALIRRWQIRCPLNTLQKQLVTIHGLSSTLTDVWVNVAWLNGTTLSTVLTPSKPDFGVYESKGIDLLAYLSLGVEHLLFGFDHILFVLGLMFFVKGFPNLVKTITAFTVAHSITLAVSSLKLVQLSQAPVEAIIALSILFLAYEASLPDRAKTISARMPWLVAFIFGLLHGFGFAGVLLDIGLPQNSAALALLLFNLGVEIGQIIVICTLLGFLFLISRWKINIPFWLEQTPIYFMGALSSYWFLQRVIPIIGL